MEIRENTEEKVGLLVHQPVTVHHVAGLAVGHAVTLLDVLTVVHHLVTLTTEVLPLESVMRLMLMNLWPLMPMSMKFLYSPGLMYIIASELGLLVHQPVTVHHVAGLALVHAESVMRLMLMNLWPLMPMSMKFLYSPGLMYIILPLNWGCSYISQ
ncbi:hypothetical protein F7725_002393 [Dissostichus mawsoni]|uniref:Uncharacterized protein n=1 Tax=Dissostichus mawsoni TaxID=36200 RepID=A0A7J5Y285_DISMA|nr:hypothetical protein F7725_002393 [Dissostichus mawsoni]